MSQGPSLQGQIIINTKSVDQAITSVRKLQTNVEKSFGLGGKAASDFSKTLQAQTKSYDQAAQSNQKYVNIIAKAANQVANYEAAVRKSNIADSKKEALIKASTAQLKGYEQAVRGGATGGQALNNVNTQLSVSLGQLKRDLAGTVKVEADSVRAKKEMEQAQIRTSNAISQASIQYEKSAQAVRTSGLAKADELATLGRLDVAQRKLTQTLRDGNTTTSQAAAAQNKFKETLAQVNLEVKKGAMAQQTAVVNKYAREMRNLSTSVVVALGPLSGVASRITALTSLFNRNAASIALVLASITALSVAFVRSSKVAEEAEKQTFRIGAQLDVLGDSAQITGEEVSAMAHSIASSTLLSAKEVRDATGALLQFGGVGRSQYEAVTKAAQGMSVVVGGSLQSNIRKLGRAIEDPSDGLQRLERYGVILTESVQENIKALSAQGKKMEATAVLMAELTGLQKAAEAEALGLAGAYDTVSGNLDKLMEDLFIGSGAAEALAGSVMSVANAISEFGDSSQAQVLGSMFKELADTAGVAFKIAIDNVGLFAGGLAFLVGSTIPKAVTALGVLAMSSFKAVKVQSAAAAAAVNGFSLAQGRATMSTKALTVALLRNPLTAVAVGIMAVVAAWYEYDDVVTRIENQHGASQDSILKGIEKELTARMSLTKTQKETYEAEAQALQDRQNQHTAALEKMIAKEAELTKAAGDALGSLLTEKRGRGRIEVQITSTDKLIRLLKTDLTDAQRAYITELLNTRQGIDDIKESAEGVTKEVEKLVNIIAEANPAQEITPAMEQLENQLKSVVELSKDFLPDIAKMDELKSDLKQAEALVKGLEESMAQVPSRSEEATAAFRRAKAVVSAIHEEMKELSKVDLNKEVVKFMDSLRDAKLEAAKLRELIGASDAAKPYIELNYEMKELQSNVESAVAAMDSEGLRQFAEALGMGAGADSSDVVGQFIALLKVQKAAAIEATKIADANDTLKEFQTDQLSTVGALTEKYRELGTAALDSGNLDQMPALSDWFNKEKAKIDALALQTSTTPFTDLATLDTEFETRRQALEDMYGSEQEQYQKHLDIMTKQSESNKMFLGFQQGAEQASDAVSQAMETMQTAGRENTAAYKAMAIVQAGINAALAVSQVLADNTLNTYAKVGMSALIGSTAGAQIAAIRSQSYATGGYVTGPGTGTSDSIAANLSNGEFVMKAEAVKNIGRRNLEMMNSGNTPTFNTGGPVGSRVMPIGGMSSASQGGEVNLTIIDNSTGDKEYTTEETVDSNGTRQLKVRIDNIVKDSIMGGSYDNEMASAFNLRRSGRRT